MGNAFMGNALIGNLTRIQSHDRRRCVAITKKAVNLATHVALLSVRVAVPVGAAASIVVGGVNLLLYAYAGVIMTV